MAVRFWTCHILFLLVAIINTIQTLAQVSNSVVGSVVCTNVNSSRCSAVWNYNNTFNVTQNPVNSSFMYGLLPAYNITFEPSFLSVFEVGYHAMQFRTIWDCVLGPLTWENDIGQPISVTATNISTCNCSIVSSSIISGSMLPQAFSMTIQPGTNNQCDISEFYLPWCNNLAIINSVIGANYSLQNNNITCSINTLLPYSLKLHVFPPYNITILFNSPVSYDDDGDFALWFTTTSQCRTFGEDPVIVLFPNCPKLESVIISTVCTNVNSSRCSAVWNYNNTFNVTHSAIDSIFLYEPFLAYNITFEPSFPSVFEVGYHATQFRTIWDCSLGPLTWKNDIGLPSSATASNTSTCNCSFGTSVILSEHMIMLPQLFSMTITPGSDEQCDISELYLPWCNNLAIINSVIGANYSLQNNNITCNTKTLLPYSLKLHVFPPYNITILFNSNVSYDFDDTEFALGFTTSQCKSYTEMFFFDYILFPNCSEPENTITSITFVASTSITPNTTFVASTRITPNATFIDTTTSRIITNATFVNTITTTTTTSEPLVICCGGGYCFSTLTEEQCQATVESAVIFPNGTCPETCNVTVCCLKTLFFDPELGCFPTLNATECDIMNGTIKADCSLCSIPDEEECLICRGGNFAMIMFFIFIGILGCCCLLAFFLLCLYTTDNLPIQEKGEFTPLLTSPTQPYGELPKFPKANSHFFSRRQ